MEKPKIICICGSSRFADIAAVKAWEFEKQGNITLGLHYLPEWYWKETNKEGCSHGAEQEGVAHILDELHLRKIEMADEVFVINKDGYIGERTGIEIKYAEKLNKPVEYLELMFEIASCPSVKLKDIKDTLRDGKSLFDIPVTDTVTGETSTINKKLAKLPKEVKELTKKLFNNMTEDKLTAKKIEPCNKIQKIDPLKIPTEGLKKSIVEGLVYFGYEESSFNQLGGNEKWWMINVSNDFKRKVKKIQTDHYSVYAKIEAEISSLGRHGHFGQYHREAKIIKVLKVRKPTHNERTVQKNIDYDLQF